LPNLGCACASQANEAKQYVGRQAEAWQGTVKECSGVISKYEPGAELIDGTVTRPRISLVLKLGGEPVIVVPENPTDLMILVSA